MKARIIILLAISAVATLSFTFKSSSKDKKAVTHTEQQKHANEPLGGFASEDKF